MNPRFPKWTVPGSTLVAGEYFITEPGRRGFAVATGARASLTLLAADTFRIRGIWPGGGCDWHPNSDSGTGIPRSLAGQVYRCLSEAGMNSRTLPSVEARIESGEFFGPNGAKKGYGSSAAAALLMTLAMGESPSEALAHTAIRAHRAHQGGRGSGYDILCSYHGGCGVFTGGENPAWAPAAWPSGLDAWILKGPAPVKSADAVERFRIWKDQCPDEYEAHAERTDQALARLELAARSGSAGTDSFAGDFLTALDLLARLGRMLGEDIGVPAVPGIPSALGRDIATGERPGVVAKCMGAGDETVLIIGRPDAFRPEETSALAEMEASGTADAVSPESKGLVQDAPA